MMIKTESGQMQAYSFQAARNAGFEKDSLEASAGFEKVSLEANAGFEKVSLEPGESGGDRMECREEELQRRLESYQRVYAQVDLGAIVENAQKLHGNTAEGTGMLGVVKADGYGHGSVPVALRLEKLDYMFGFAVATPEEAYVLRAAGIRKPVVILGYPCHPL